MTGADGRYTDVKKLALAGVMLARKLRPYFQSHLIIMLTTQPLRFILYGPSKSGRLVKWHIELSEYNIENQIRMAAKLQVPEKIII